MKNEGESNMSNKGMISRRRLIQLGAAGVLATPALLRNTKAFAQAYPEKPITFVVGFDPGGSTDTVARLVAGKLSATLGQSVIVENKPGAGATIGADFVAKSAPDGYTVSVGDFGPSVMAGLLMKDLPYDPLTSFAHVVRMVSFPFVLVVPESSPLTSLSQLIEEAKANPGKLSYSSAGIGTSSHLFSELMNSMAGIQTTHAPYKGGAPAVQALVSGEVSYTMNSVPTTLGQIKGGKVRALAVTSATATPSLPDVPPIASLLSGYEAFNFHGLHMPAGAPAEIVDKLNAEVIKVLQDPEVVAKLNEIAITPATDTPAEFTSFIDSQIKTWSDVMKKANISVQ